MATRIKLRRDTAANWLDQNPILAMGEPGMETDTRMMKFGDGATAWADLKYAVTGDLQVTDSTIHGNAGVSLSSGLGNRENWILKTNATYDGTLTTMVDAYPTGVAYDSEGNAFVMGTYDSPGPGVYLQKVSPAGEVLWSNYYNEYASYGFGMAIHNNNLVMILSEYDSYSDDVLLVKLWGDDGSIVWQKRLDSYGDYNDQASCIDIDSTGDIFITGNAQNAGPDNNDLAYVAKFAGGNGALIWSKSYDIDGFDSTGTGLKVDKDGNVGIVGSVSGPGNFVTVYKLSGADGSVTWQGKILNVKGEAENGNTQYDYDLKFANIQSSDLTVDTQGNFYLTFSWYHPYYGGSSTFIAKFNGTTGKAAWVQHLTWFGYNQSAGSVICDELDNVYVSNTLDKYKENYEMGSSNRPTLNITKINSTGSIVWQRWLSAEQGATWDGKSGVGFDAIGQSIAINKDYIAVVGTYYMTSDYSNSQNWYTSPYIAQLSRDGSEFDVNGWKFVDSVKDTNTVFSALVTDANDWTYDPADVNDFDFNVGYGDVGYETNTDPTDLVYINKTNVHQVTFEEKTLTLPSGGTINVSREKNGYITAIGAFDSSEGGEGSNWSGAVWLNGNDRDEKGATYSAGGWYTYNTWNNWNDYENIPMVFKTDADGKLIWQAGNALDQGGADLVDVVYHQPTNTVIALGNDGEMDGAEGFNILYLDADTGSMKQDITHIRPSIREQERNQDIYPQSLRVMSDGTPVVSGYINTAYDTFGNVTLGGAGLTGSTNYGALVIPRTTFVREGHPTEYPTDDGNWYLYPDSAAIYYINTYGYEETHPDVVYTGTLGSGATVDVVITSSTPAITLVSGGSGYKAGQRVKILGSDTGAGDDIYFYIDSVDGDGAITAINSTYDWGATNDGTYSAVNTTAMAGTGVDVQVSYPDGDTYLVNVTNSGYYYGAGDTFKILGTQLGGATPANDLTFTVNDIVSTGRLAGQINTITVGGTPQSTNIKLYAGSADYTQAGEYDVVHELSDDSFIWTPNWSLTFGSADTSNGDYDEFMGMTVDSSDNVIAVGYSDTTGLGNETTYWGNRSQTGVVAKFDGTTGDVLWATSVDGSEGQGTVWSVVTDADDNVYSAMKDYNDDLRVTKQNSDGEFVWQTVYRLDNSESFAMDITPEGDIMITGEIYHEDFQDNDYHQYNWGILVVKIDKDGNLMYSRLIWSTNGIYFNDHDTYSNQLTVKGDRFSIAAYSSDPGDYNYQGIVIDLPSDGTGTGDYGNFHYEEVELYPQDRYINNNNGNSDPIVTPITMALRPHTFESAPYEDGDAWRNVSIYGNRDHQIQTIHKPEGGKVTGVAKIVFEDGSEQTTSMQGLPQVETSRINSGGNDYWLRPEDNGKHIYKRDDYSIIIPSPNRQALPIGFAFTIITTNWSVVVWSENYDETLWLADGTGNDSDASVTLDNYTMTTFVHVEDGSWAVAGTGVSTGGW